ncbi:MAG: thiopurine S-methyltransferase [Candidatus Sericytochromatia bacterium]
MDKDFWLTRWEQREIAFHGNEANPLLINNFEKLGLKEESTIFVPLCGKTLDIAWLLAKGHKIIGCELVETAIKELFEELNLIPKITELGTIKHYSYENLDIFVGDVFELTKEHLGKIDAIYDRAALVALPYDLRIKYTKHLIDITEKAPKLLVVYEYDQEKLDGPPFSITDEEVKKHYEGIYTINCLSKNEVEGGLKGKCPTTENVWLIK